MSNFLYNALDAQGKTVSGNFTAGNREAVLDYVYEKGLRPVSVKELPEKNSGTERFFLAGTGRVTQAAVESFIRQLANLLTAGVPLGRALEIVARETKNAAASKQWNAIRNDVMGGISLAGAMAKWPQSFPPVYVAMVRGGEAGGFLSVVLEQIAEFRAREQTLQGRVKAALVYPVLLAFLAGAVLIFLLTFFIPRFSGIFADFGGSLPRLTLLIVRFSKLVVRYGLVVVMAVVIAVVWMRRFFAGETGRRMFEKAVLNIPSLGVVAARFALVRFCRMLGTLLGAGVPLVNALNIAREAIGNRTLSDAVTQAVESVKGGSSLARGLGSSERLFPPTVVEMVAVAEESGNLDKELVRLASTYEADLDRQLRMLVAVIEPLLLFVMAAVVGVMVIGMLLPIFTLQDLIH